MALHGNVNWNAVPRGFLRTPDRFRSEWLCVVADIIGAGKLFQKEQNGDTGIDLNIVRTGKIGVKGLVVEYGEYPLVFGEYSPTFLDRSRQFNQFCCLLQKG